MTQKIIYLAIVLAFVGSCAEIDNNRDHKNKNGTQKMPSGFQPISSESIRPLPVFFTDQLTKNGIPIYFGFEEVDQNNVDFWEQYKKTSGDLAGLLKRLPKRIKANTHKSSISVGIKKILGYDDAKYDILIDFIKTSPKNQGEDDENGLFQLFFGVEGGFAGMNLKDLSQTNRVYHVIYASSAPITRRFVNADYVETNTFEENFGKIIMSMAGITVPNVPTTTHTGISRNPLDFIKGHKEYAGIAMKLHGFGATVWRMHFENKKYMITMPLESMAKIFKSQMDSKYIWLGDFPDEVKELKKNGVDFDFSHFTGGSQKTTVDLESLRSFWP